MRQNWLNWGKLPGKVDSYVLMKHLGSRPQQFLCTDLAHFLVSYRRKDWKSYQDRLNSMVPQRLTSTVTGVSSNIVTTFFAHPNVFLTLQRTRKILLFSIEGRISWQQELTGVSGANSGKIRVSDLTTSKSALNRKQQAIQYSLLSKLAIPRHRLREFHFRHPPPTPYRRELLFVLLDRNWNQRRERTQWYSPRVVLSFLQDSLYVKSSRQVSTSVLARQIRILRQQCAVYSEYKSNTRTFSTFNFRSAMKQVQTNILKKQISSYMLS